MRRPSHPESGTTTPRAREYPVTTQATASAEPLSSTWMSGIATLTMLLSNTDMKLPTISTASGTIQPRSGGGAGAAVRVDRVRRGLRDPRALLAGDLLVVDRGHGTPPLTCRPAS